MYGWGLWREQEDPHSVFFEYGVVSISGFDEDVKRSRHAFYLETGEVYSNSPGNINVQRRIGMITISLSSRGYDSSRLYL